MALSVIEAERAAQAALLAAAMKYRGPAPHASNDRIFSNPKHNLLVAAAAYKDARKAREAAAEAK